VRFPTGLRSLDGNNIASTGTAIATILRRVVTVVLIYSELFSRQNGVFAEKNWRIDYVELSKGVGKR